MEVFGTPYMTQAVELPITGRMYWSRIVGAEVSTGDYRGASAEERDKWMVEIENLNARRYGKN